MARQMGCPKVDRALMADTAALVASEPTGSKYKVRLNVVFLSDMSQC